MHHHLISTEYIRNKGDILADRKARQEYIQSQDPVTVPCEIRVIEGTERERKLVYKIFVAFGTQQWYIYRFEKQINEFCFAVRVTKNQ